MLFLILQDTFKLYSSLHKQILDPRPSKEPPLHLDPLYFDQFNDHFNPQDQSTFKQKYYVNDSVFAPGGPIIISIGGEGPIYEGNVGYSYSEAYFAEELNGVMIALEHRGYGESFPYNQNANMSYVSSKQTIADYSSFIPFIKQQFPTAKNVIVAGGSYPGNLAGWLRTQLPHLIDAAIASSGPVTAVADFSLYLQHAQSQLLRYGGEKCVNAMKIVSDASEMIEDSSKWEMLAKAFHCDINEFATYDEIDKKMWTTNIATAISAIVQYSRSKDCCGVPEENDIKIACDTMTSRLTENYQLEEVLADFAAATSLDQQTNTEMGYHAMVDYLRDSDLSEDQSSRSWMWQSCSEFGYFQTSTFEGSVFPQVNDINLWAQMCWDAFYIDIFARQNITSNMSIQILNSAVEQTNIWYGARNQPRDKIYWCNGDVDPWSELSVRNDYAWEDGQYIKGAFHVIEGGSHCTDMERWWTANDDVREDQLNKLKEWLNL